MTTSTLKLWLTDKELPKLVHARTESVLPTRLSEQTAELRIRVKESIEIALPRMAASRSEIVTPSRVAENTVAYLPKRM